MTNVVEDNNNLRFELKEAMAEINRLDAHNQKLLDKLTAKGVKEIPDQDVFMVDELDMYHTI